MIRRTLTWVATGAAFAALGLGCSSKSGSGPSGVVKTGPVVAHVGNDVITADEVKTQMGERAPYERVRLANEPEARKQFVEDLVRNEVFAQEAEREGLDKSADVQIQYHRLLVQQLVRKENEQKIDVSDDDLKAYFAKHESDYNRPEKVRVQEIFLAADAGNAKARAEAKAKAQKFLAQIKADLARNGGRKGPATSPNSQVMLELARDNSADTETAKSGGVTWFMSKDDFAKKYSPELANAVFNLSPGNSMSGVIDTPQGFFLARFLGKQAASSQTLDDPNFKRQISARYVAEARSKRLQDYYQELRKSANVTIDDAALAAIEVPAGGGRPGFNFPGAGMPRSMPPIANGTPPPGLHPVPAQATPGQASMQADIGGKKN